MDFLDTIHMCVPSALLASLSYCYKNNNNIKIKHSGLFRECDSGGTPRIEQKETWGPSHGKSEVFQIIRLEGHSITKQLDDGLFPKKECVINKNYDNYSYLYDTYPMVRSQGVS